jgi:hypothetical protein
MNEARDYELSLHTTSTVVDSAQVNSPAMDGSDNHIHILTLAELKELIESGNMDKIPNNKIIPETLNVRSFSFFFFL